MLDFTSSLTNLPEALQPALIRDFTEFFSKTEISSSKNWPAVVIESLPRVWSASPFIAGHCIRVPDLLPTLIYSGRLNKGPTPQEEYKNGLRECTDYKMDELEWMAALRRFRNKEMVRIAWRDIAGWASLSETLTEVSLLAEVCVQESLDFLFQRACALRGTPINRKGEPQPLVVLGMGKLGAWELNFSSDIDLIFVYRDEGVLSDKKETTYSEFYTRLAQRLIHVLDTFTEDGFVFRVDTRLRPFGESGPLVMNFDAFDAYYEAQAREWERYAMVKARTIAGDYEAGEELERSLIPFVYRRYLDFRVLGELRELKRKISVELRRKDRQENIKLGPGGIREIEFIGQVFQLIRGGQEIRLRERRIQVVLDVLATLHLMSTETITILQRAYHYLRTVENRLQQYADRQVHEIPTDPLQRASLAYVMGHSEWASFMSELDTVRSAVHAIFQQVITPAEADHHQMVWLDADPETLIPLLQSYEWSLTEAEEAIVLLQQFKSVRSIRHLTARGELELQRLLPFLLRAITQTRTATLERVCALLGAIAGRTAYLTLLSENPQALAHLVKLASSSPWIVHYIARFPVLLDELLDPRTLYTPLSKKELSQELSYKCGSISPNDQEQLMVTLRRFKQANVLRIAAADLSNVIPIMVVSDYLTYLAEVLLEWALCEAWQYTAQKHGPPPNTKYDEINGFAIIAYGKLGGFELGYSSDLDIVFLYTGDGTASTTGNRPITVAEFFSRVAKRIIHLLTTNTSAGRLYEIDLRLRPSGNSGLLVSHVDAYETYQIHNAWTWEHQALCKARFIAGDVEVGKRFAAIRIASLRCTRNQETLRADIYEMREKMRTTLGLHTCESFHLKHDEGGIVDIEFLVQYGLLSKSDIYPSLTEWTDVVRQLDSLTNVGLLTTSEAKLLRQAYCAFREEVHRAALQEVSPVVSATRFPALRAEVHRLWQEKCAPSV